MREHVEEVGAEHACHHREATHLQEGADRIGALDLERAPVLWSECLRQGDKAEHHVGEGEPGGDEKRSAWPELAEEAADDRAEHEPGTERGANQAEVLCARFSGGKRSAM